MAGKIKMARAIKFLNQLNKLKHREGFEAYAAFIRSVEVRSSSKKKAAPQPVCFIFYGFAVPFDLATLND